MDFYQIFGEYGAAAVAWVLAIVVLPVVVRAINSWVKNGKVASILTRLTAGLERAINEVAQVYADEIKHASEDGVLTEKEKARALELAIGAVKSYLGPKGIKELLAILGIKVDALDLWLSQRIEGQLKMGKSRTEYAVEYMVPSETPRATAVSEPS